MSIHPTAIVVDGALVHPTAVLGPNVVVESGVQIAADCRIGPFAVLMTGTQIGERCRIHAFAVVGDVPQDRSFEGGESFCRIGDDCVLREGVTIHRGTSPDSETVVGNHCRLMTNSHVGHNCVLGEAVTLGGGVLLAGHVRVGDRAVISSNAAVHQFVRVGERARIQSLAKITQDVPPFHEAGGDAAIVGLNAAALQGDEPSPDERREIEQIHGVVYGTHATLRSALLQLRPVVHTAAARRLLQFLAEVSHRGITAGGRR